MGFFDNLIDTVEDAGGSFFKNLINEAVPGAGIAQQALKPIAAPAAKATTSLAGSLANFALGTNTALSPSEGQTNQQLEQQQAAGPSYGTTLNKEAPTIVALTATQALAPLTGGASEALVPEEIGGSAALGSVAQSGVDAFLSNLGGGVAGNLVAGESPGKSLEDSTKFAASMLPLGMAGLVPGEGVLGSAARVAAGSAIGAGSAKLFGQDPLFGALQGAMGSQRVKEISPESIQQTLDQAKTAYAESPLASQAGSVPLDPSLPFSDPGKNIEPVLTPDETTLEAQMAASGKATNSPAMASFLPDPNGSSKLHTWNSVNNMEGLMNDLQARGIPMSAMSPTGNDLNIVDPDGKFGSIMNKAAKENNMESQLSTSNGYSNVMERNQYEPQSNLSSAQSAPGVQSNAVNAGGELSQQATQEGHHVQAALLSENGTAQARPNAVSPQVLTPAQQAKEEAMRAMGATPQEAQTLALQDERDPHGLDGTERIVQHSLNLTPEEAVQAKDAAIKGPQAVQDLSHDQQRFVAQVSDIREDPTGNTFKAAVVKEREAAGLSHPVNYPDNTDFPGADYTVSGNKAALETALRPELDILNNKGRSQEAQLLAQRVSDSQENFSNMAAPMLTKLEDARKGLSKSQYEEAIDVAEGKKTTTNAAINHWVNTWKEVASDIANKAKTLGIKVWDPTSETYHDFQELQNFFPHVTPKEVVDTLQSKKLTPFANKLIEEGRAANLAEVKQFIRDQLGPRENSIFGNLEIGRSNVNLPFIKDPRIAESYVRQALQREAWVNQFGLHNEEADRLIAAMRAKGDIYGAERSQALISRLDHLQNKTISEQGMGGLTKGLRTFETVTKLPFVGLKHLSQIPRIMSQNGVLNTTLHALGSIIDGSGKELARNSSIALHDELKGYDFGQDGNKITNAFLKGIGFKNEIQWVRQLATTTAKSQLDHFVDDMNKTGDLSKKAVRFIQRAGLNPDEIRSQGGYTTEQLNKYINTSLSNTSLYFKEGDLPPGWNTSIGKVLTMFKTFGYNDLVRGVPPLLREAQHGNIMPLLIMIAGGTAVGTGTYDLEHEIRHPGQPLPSAGKQLLAGATTAGLGGLVGEQVGQAIESPKYIPSQLVSLLGGPAASDLYNAAQGVSGLATGNQQAQNQALTSLLGNVPLVGPTIAQPLANKVVQSVSPAQAAINNLVSNNNAFGGGNIGSSGTSGSGVGSGGGGSRTGTSKNAGQAQQRSRQRAAARSARRSPHVQSSGGHRARTSFGGGHSRGRVSTRTSRRA